MREVDGIYIGICDVCGGEYKNDPGVYEGNRLELYGDAFCCNSCWRSNSDGWGPIHEKRIKAICAEKAVAMPARNSKGWLPRS